MLCGAHVEVSMCEKNLFDRPSQLIPLLFGRGIARAITLITQTIIDALKAIKPKSAEDLEVNMKGQTEYLHNLALSKFSSV